MRRNCHVECEDNFFIVTACDNQRINNKQAKNSMAFNSLNNGLGIKYEEQHILKDDHINEEKLSEVSHDHRHEKIFHIMTFDKNTFLDSMKHVRITRHKHHSCSPNFYV